GASLPLISVADPAPAADQPETHPAAHQAGPTPFDGSTVRNLARQLAAKQDQMPSDELPSAFRNLDYSAYQGIRFDQAQSLWRGQGLNFTAQFFHRGYIYPDRVS